MEDQEMIPQGTSVRVTTVIPLQIKKAAEAYGWKIAELIRLGYLAKKGNPQLIERINEQQQKIDQLTRKQDRLATQMTEIAMEQSRQKQDISGRLAV